MGGLWGWSRHTEPLSQVCIFIQTRSSPSRELASRELELSTSWIVLPQFPPHLPPPSSSNAGKQLGLCMVWVFSSSLCFSLLVFLSIYRIAMVLSLCVDAGKLFYLGCVAPWASAFPVPGWGVLRSVGSWVFQCSLWFYLPVRERKCSPWVWPRTEGVFFSMTTVNRH